MFLKCKFFESTYLDIFQPDRLDEIMIKAKVSAPETRQHWTMATLTKIDRISGDLTSAVLEAVHAL